MYYPNKKKNVRCSVYLSPEVVARIDRACGADRWTSKSRSTVIERALRAHYKMPKMEQESRYHNTRRRRVIGTPAEPS